MRQTGQLRGLEREDGTEGGWLSWVKNVLSSPIKWAWYNSASAVADQRYVDTQLLTVYVIPADGTYSGLSLVMCAGTGGLCTAQVAIQS